MNAHRSIRISLFASLILAPASLCACGGTEGTAQEESSVEPTGTPAENVVTDEVSRESRRPKKKHGCSNTFAGTSCKTEFQTICATPPKAFPGPPILLECEKEGGGALLWIATAQSCVCP